MSYENAPSTQMLASRCAFCARKLRDAQSVEVGIGPSCRDKYMVADAVTEEARVEGNKLIHTIAQLQTGKEVTEAVVRLKELGFVEVVKRINKRIVKGKPIELTYVEGRLHIQVPWVPKEFWDAWLDGMRAINGMRFEGSGKGNSFPMRARQAVYDLLCEFFPHQRAEGPKGEFVIGLA